MSGEVFQLSPVLTQWLEMVKVLGGEATIHTYTRNKKTIHVVGATHYSREAVEHIKAISATIADPSQWLFLIEGGESRTGEAITDEVDFAVAIAKMLSIPVHDPILSQTCPETLQRFVLTETGQDFSFEQLATLCAIVMSHAAGDDSLDGLKVMYGLSAASFSIGTNTLITDSLLIDDTERFAQVLDHLLPIGNAFSSQVLDYYLSLYPDCSNVLLYCGNAHESIVTIQRDDIPNELRLTKTEIKRVLQKRATRQRRLNKYSETRLLKKSTADS